MRRIIAAAGAGATAPTSSAIAMPLPAVNGYAQAAQFSDMFGVNIHTIYSGTTYDNEAQLLVELRALGIRHIRDAVIGSDHDFRWLKGRPFWKLLHAHNQNVPAGEQPIFLLGITDNWPPEPPYSGAPPQTAEMYFKTIMGGRQHYNGNSSPSATIPNVGFSIPDGPTTDPAGVPANWDFDDPEVPWSLMSGFTNANEPQLGKPVVAQNNIDEHQHDLMAERNLYSRPACYGHPVVTTEGIQDDVTTDRLPMVGPAPTDYSAAWGNGSMGTVDLGQGVGRGRWGDFTGTQGYMADAGDVHPYQAANEPTFTAMQGQITSQRGITGDLRLDGEPNEDPAGRAAASDRSKGLPLFATEMGYVTDLTALDAGVVGGTYPGYWPVDPQVAGEYLIRHFAINFVISVGGYATRINRGYIYEMMDQTPGAEAETRFGLVTHDWQRKPNFYAVRNLLSLIGFTEAPVADQVKPSYTVSGFTAGPNNTQPGAEPPNTYNSPDRLDHFIVQQEADVPGTKQYVVVIWRQLTLWNVPQLTFRDPSAKLQTLTVNFPAGIASAAIAQPTAGGSATPEDGRTWNSTTITGGTSVQVPISGWMKLLKVTV